MESTPFFLSWSSLIFRFNRMNYCLVLLHSCHPGTSFSFHSWIISTVSCVPTSTLFFFILAAREYPQVMSLHVWKCLYSAFWLDGSFGYKNLGQNYFALEISEARLCLLQLRVSDFSHILHFSPFPSNPLESFLGGCVISQDLPKCFFMGQKVGHFLSFITWLPVLLCKGPLLLIFPSGRFHHWCGWFIRYFWQTL